MKKFAVAVVSVVAFAGLTAGAANAACPAVSPDTKDSAGTPILFTGLELGVGNPVTVYGEDPLGLGDGESVIGVNTTTGDVTYDGQLAGDVGHGDIENASVGASGVHGTADGQAAGLVSGSGSLDVSATGASLSVGGSSPVLVIPCTTVP